MCDKNENGQPICVTGLNPNGFCSCCRYDKGIKCCAGCRDRSDCNIVCGWIAGKSEE